MIFIVVGLPQGVATRPAGATGLSARTEDLFARGGRESAKNKFGGTKPISNNPFPILRIHPMSSANTRRIKGRWRGDSTEFDSRVEICRKVSKSVAFRRAAEDLSGASGVLAIAFQFNGIANCFRRGRGASMGRSGRQTECRVEMSGARRRR